MRFMILLAVAILHFGPVSSFAQGRTISDPIISRLAQRCFTALKNSPERTWPLDEGGLENLYRARPKVIIPMRGPEPSSLTASLSRIPVAHGESGLLGLAFWDVSLRRADQELVVFDFLSHRVRKGEATIQGYYEGFGRPSERGGVQMRLSLGSGWAPSSLDYRFLVYFGDRIPRPTLESSLPLPASSFVDAPQTTGEVLLCGEGHGYSCRFQRPSVPWNGRYYTYLSAEGKSAFRTAVREASRFNSSLGMLFSRPCDEQFRDNIRRGMRRYLSENPVFGNKGLDHVPGSDVPTRLSPDMDGEAARNVPRILSSLQALRQACSPLADALGEPEILESISPIPILNGYANWDGNSSAAYGDRDHCDPDGE